MAEQRIITLDDFAQSPLTEKTRKFMDLCEYYRSISSQYPHSAYEIYDFIHEHTLPYDLKVFKLLDISKIISYYWKWPMITKYGKVGSCPERANFTGNRRKLL